MAIAKASMGSITMLTVRGAGGVDVHLVAGPEDAATGEVLGESMSALAGARPLGRGSSLPEGETAPCLVVTTLESHVERPPFIVATTVRFDLSDRHDLVSDPDLFGIRAALDQSRGHFPGVSTEPLAIEQAEQLARATFSASGFEAAAVNLLGMVRAAHREPPDQPIRVRMIRLTFDRPFGVVAVDRGTVFAGWVAEPDELNLEKLIQSIRSEPPGDAPQHLGSYSKER